MGGVSKQRVSHVAVPLPGPPVGIPVADAAAPRSLGTHSPVVSFRWVPRPGMPVGCRRLRPLSSLRQTWPRTVAARLPGRSRCFLRSVPCYVRRGWGFRRIGGSGGRPSPRLVRGLPARGLRPMWMRSSVLGSPPESPSRFAPVSALLGLLSPRLVAWLLPRLCSLRCVALRGPCRGWLRSRPGGRCRLRWFQRRLCPWLRGAPPI